MRSMRWAALVLSAGAAAYIKWGRAIVMGWGARPDELTRPLPGDDLVPGARSQATHAITIAAPPDVVWPWLLQVGNGRAGWYSYDWLDNQRKPSADAIMPAWQHLAVGERIPMTPDGKVSIPVTAVEPNRSLVLGGREKDAAFAASWVFVLEPIEQRRTRLLVRLRVEFPPTLSGWLWLVGIEPAHFIMQRKQLLNLKARAERQAHEAVRAPHSDTIRDRMVSPSSKATRPDGTGLSLPMSPAHG